MLLPTTTTIPSVVNLLPQEHEYDYTLVEGEEATTTRISQLTFDDIEWFNASNPTLRVNDSEYLILTDGNKVILGNCALRWASIKIECHTFLRFCI